MVGCTWLSLHYRLGGGDSLYYNIATAHNRRLAISSNDEIKINNNDSSYIIVSIVILISSYRIQSHVSSLHVQPPCFSLLYFLSTPIIIIIVNSINDRGMGHSWW